MAKQAGLERPYRMQSLLGRGLWSADDLRDIVRDYLWKALGDSDDVLIVDETGFVKKNVSSAARAILPLIPVRRVPGMAGIAT